MTQEKEIIQPQGWLEDVRTLKSDRALLASAKQGLLATFSNSSKEDFQRTLKIIAFFSMVIEYKEWKVKEMLYEHLDPNGIRDQRRVILDDWPVILFSSDWQAKELLKLSGGGAKKRGEVIPTAKKAP